MELDRRKLLVLGGAALVRIALPIAFPALPNFLTGRVEISTPVTSFKRLQEGLFLFTHNVSPYDGGVFYQAPLLLPIFSSLPPAFFEILVALLFLFLDLSSAWLIGSIAETKLSGRERQFLSPRAERRWDAYALMAAYLFNPLTVATCLGRSTLLFTNTAILFAIWKAVQGRPLHAMIALAVAAYLSLYPLLLLPSIAILARDQHARVSKTAASMTSALGSSTAMFTIAVAMLLWCSWSTTGHSWEFLASTYGSQLLLVDLTPNVGLWWYFFIEMFDSFREFFLGVFWLHLAGYVGGLCIRIYRQPLFVTVAILGLIAIFKPYPSVADTSLYLGLLPFYQHVFPLMRYTFFACAMLLYCTLLGPAFHYLWIYAGSGNANFFYAITLVWSLGLSVIVADSIWAVLRDEWEMERPEMRGRLVKQI